MDLENKPHQTKNQGNQQKNVSVQETIRKPDTLFLYFCVMTGQLVTMAFGASMAWTSPVLGKLYSNNTDINPLGRPITSIEVSLLASMPTFTNILGMLVMPKISDIVGRKRYLLIAGVLTLFSGVGLGFSGASLVLMIVTRCLFSFSAGWVVFSLYLMEICEDHNRGKFGCYVGIFNQIGNFFGFVFGPFFSVKTFSFIITSPILIFVVIFTVMPESPVYLLKHGKEKECKKALRKLRSNKTEDEIELDLKKLKYSLQNEPKGKIADLFKKRENFLAVVLSFLPQLIKYSSGVTVIFTFLAPYFNEAGTSLSGDMVAILVAVVKVTSFVLASFIVERFGRRKLLILSSTGTAIPLFTAGVYFYLQSINSSLIAYLQWLPLTSLLFTVCFFGIGLGPVSQVMTSELPPAEIRAVSVSLVHSTGSFVAFAFTFLYPLISESLGTEWCVWWFSINCTVGSALIYFFLPETKGKSFVEIKEMLKNYSKLQIK
uniref:Glucosinolate transporter n=1 Tax=Phyllotreta armoraciae TaxID=1553667 RepID=A0A858Z6P2_9CUCU|nr:glucosinolate transporter [Phyllotreta armoraciae]